MARSSYTLTPVLWKHLKRSQLRCPFLSMLSRTISYCFILYAQNKRKPLLMRFLRKDCVFLYLTLVIVLLLWNLIMSEKSLNYWKYNIIVIESYTKKRYITHLILTRWRLFYNLFQLVSLSYCWLKQYRRCYKVTGNIDIKQKLVWHLRTKQTGVHSKK